MIGLYFGGQWFQTVFGNEYGNIELDASLEEVHEWSAEVTSNPVEVGAPITDHVIDKSDKLLLRGFVTDTPLTASATISGVVNSGSVGNRTQGVFDLLHQLLKLKQPMTVYTKHRIYDDMMLSDIRIPRSAGVGEAIEFNAEFINIRKVATQVVDVPDGINPKKEAKGDPSTGRKSEPQRDGGKKQAETIEKPSSTLSRIFK